MLADFDLWSFLGGLVSGGLGGAFLTLSITKKNQSSAGHGNAVDQSNATAGGDIVGRDKQ